MKVAEIRTELRRHADPVRAEGSRRYFKDSSGDRFLGVNTPLCRVLAKAGKDLPLKEVESLMRSAIHEERSVGQMILVEKFRKGSAEQKREVYNFLMKLRKTLTTWDAVDGTAPYIVGPYLLERERTILYTLAGSRSIWDRRIAMVATLYFVRQGQTEDAFRIAEMLLNDSEDLIHKACGWILRETGKKNPAGLETFLQKHYWQLPRTTLRYAIERFPERKRKAYLRGEGMEDGG